MTWQEQRKREQEEHAARDAEYRKMSCVSCGDLIGASSYSTGRKRGGELRIAHSFCAVLRSREPRACTRCGFVRTVAVVTWATSGDESFARLCTACDAETRAEKHEEAALRFRERASELRAKQKRQRSGLKGGK